jgi:hypothetical protein
MEPMGIGPSGKIGVDPLDQPDHIALLNDLDSGIESVGVGKIGLQPVRLDRTDRAGQGEDSQDHGGHRDDEDAREE